MRNKIIIFGIIILIVLNYNEGDRVIYIDEKSNQVVNTNALTMMYETEAGSGEYQVSNDTNWPQEGYSFNEKLSGCENGGELSWNDETKRVIMKANTSDKCYIYFDKVLTLAEYITTQVYTGTDGDNGLYYHDGSGSYINADQEAGDNSYRYAGANPNNYVCFGSDEETCPADNLYRMIGVFDSQVKLIKYDYAESDLLVTTNLTYGNSEFYSESNYYKGNKNQNDIPIFSSIYYNYSTLTETTLNQNYLNNIGSKWSDLIAEHTWYVGGANYDVVYNASVKTVYDYEVGTNKVNTTYNAKIRLMYVSDYGYAASSENWTVNMRSLNNATNRVNNWMFMGLYEWTTMRNFENDVSTFFIAYDGSVGATGSHFPYAVRPSFYLESSVVLTGGTGTASDPYRVQM